MECDGLKQRLQRLERELNAVSRISKALYSRTDLDDVDSLERQVLEAAQEAVDADAGTIYLHDAERGKIIFKYVIGAAATELTGLEIPDSAETSVVGRAIQTVQSYITLDARTATEHNREIGEKVDFVTRNIVTVPLCTMGGQCLGALQVLNKRSGNFDEEDRDLLTILGRQAASAIETAMLYREQKLAAVTHRIGDISHDVKNMVTPIQTGTQTLELMMDSMFEELDRCLEDGTVTPEVAEQIQWAWDGVRGFYHEAMQMTYEGVNATQERVKEIADAVKGIIAEPNFVETDVREVIDPVVRTLRLVAEPKGVTIDTSGVQTVPSIELDRNMIKNAVYNLINNAWPETPEGGFIYVRTRLTQPDEDNEAPRLQIEIADTGHGIPEAIRAKLFTEQAVSTKVGGTGLGTRIVKTAADAHHGTITVASEEGKGSTFTIRIPLRQPT